MLLCRAADSRNQPHFLSYMFHFICPRRGLGFRGLSRVPFTLSNNRASSVPLFRWTVFTFATQAAVSSPLCPYSCVYLSVCSRRRGALEESCSRAPRSQHRLVAVVSRLLLPQDKKSELCDAAQTIRVSPFFFKPFTSC